MNKIKGIILSLVAVGAVLIPLSASAAWYSPIYNLGSNIFSAIESIFQPRVVQILGNTTPIAGTTYTLAGPGLNSTVTSINLNSFTIPQTGYRIQTSDLGSIVYFTIEPGNSQRQEIVSCTGVTQAGGSSLATLTGCLRGLAPIYPYTASTTYAFTHSAGVAVVISNPPQLFNLYAAKDNNETITGDWHVPAPAGSSSIANKFYADSLTYAGAPPLSEIVAGLGIGATQLEMMTGTATSTYGTSTYQNILQAKYANATSSATTTIPITQTNGKLSQGFLDLTQDFTFSGTSSFTGLINASSTTNLSTTTVNGLTTFNNSVVFNGFVSGGNLAHTLVYIASSTFTAPNASTTLYITLVGGGGGGGASSNSNANGGGGGGGGSTANCFTTVSANSTTTVSVGSKGMGGTAGNNNATAGGNSTFSSCSSGLGGGLGGLGSGSGGGSAGTVSQSWTGSSGTAGGSGSGGTGGYSEFGDGAAAPASNAPGVTSTVGYGGGGSGANESGGGLGQSGGNGTNGLIIIRY